ncbi:class I SAM-dependent methyltransferase [Asticcacaulis sp. ZE23SCel15]|uniref:class I SAM-dependent methyltransferase n=1 Tax=Asticcacaulis sp. ZE23SCel15 TaxID=3059027 RepID=UPI00265DA597|nr:class I SAM-dependent methyltransferase [Asticcacaulis sp. ZE23SCel15]WKL58976.1 class I SAM-dependent methyltransferase [Asticcacaulis sp. ZE23SCel15]
MTDKMADLFKDPEHARTYAERPRKIIPGFDGLHRIMAQLIGEASPAQTLVLGGGGGLELKTLSDALPNGQFCAVDPSAEMIAQGKAYLGDPASVEWVEGLIFEAPEGPFDAATCMLTLHFVPDEGAKLETLKAVKARLKPGAPFFIAHMSVDKDDPKSGQKFDRYLRYAQDSQLDPQVLKEAHERVRTGLNTVGPERDEQLLREAGFSGIELVFKGLYWCGWIAYA